MKSSSRQLRRAGIVGTGSYVPTKIITNFDLEKRLDTSDEWIRSRTGISERRIAAPHEATSDLALAAARRALEDARIAAADLDLIIVATCTPDMPFPATAAIVQAELGATRAAAFDLNAVCSGFSYGLEVGAQMIAGGSFERVLVIGADIMSRTLNWDDRSTCVLFGDGAGAVVLGPVEAGGLVSSVLGADGTGGPLLCIPAGGSREPISADKIDDCRNTMQMNGREVYKFAVQVMGEAAVQALDKCGLGPSDVALFIPHQANIRIIESAAKRLGLPSERVFVNLDRYGNTSAASIPLALDEAVRSGRVGEGDIVVTVGFGAGLTWGANVIQWTASPRLALPTCGY
ncbi:MAG TPA: beta-ketoacyl-ACP synthase III [Capsulimonadaceae bacterium]|nr:beta-ketoacyl-ACP synthase III [Capsulimonadaceae bacterium]